MTEFDNMSYFTLNTKYDYDKVIRKVADFPKPGILFYDVTSVFNNADALRNVIEDAYSIYKNTNITRILAVESRGFMIGGALGFRMGLPVALARKKGKLPGKTVAKSYDLEYGSATLEIHLTDIKAGDNILIIDDLIATGGTLKACRAMVEELGAKVAGIFGVIGLPFLNYKEVLSGCEVKTLIDYHVE